MARPHFLLPQINLAVQLPGDRKLADLPSPWNMPFAAHLGLSSTYRQFCECVRVVSDGHKGVRARRLGSSCRKATLHPLQQSSVLALLSLCPSSNGVGGPEPLRRLRLKLL